MSARYTPIAIPITATVGCVLQALSTGDQPSGVYFQLRIHIVGLIFANVLVLVEHALCRNARSVRRLKCATNEDRFSLDSPPTRRASTTQIMALIT